MHDDHDPGEAPRAHPGSVAHRRRPDRPQSAPRSVAAIRDSDELVSWLATAAVTTLALFLRLWDLGKPRAFLFDETYYAKDAWSLVHNGYVARLHL